MLIAALAYARMGWSILPLKPGAKQPLASNGVYAATTNPSIIRTWWERTPDANIGIATGNPLGAFVVDVDVRNDGPAQLEQLERIYGPLSPTLKAWTATGGWHLYYKIPGCDLKGKMATGVDIKTTGGYVVAPPSIIDGQAYRWYSLPSETEITQPDAWLLDSIRQERHSVPSDEDDVRSPELSARARKYIAAVPGAVQGQGGSTHTLKLAAKLVHEFKLDNESAFQLLREWNVTCLPEWTDHELRRKVTQAATKYRKRT